MVVNKIEGDLSGINNRQLEFIDDVISELGFKVQKVNIAALGIAGDNYASNVKRVTVEGENDVLSLVVKIAPENEVIRKSFNTSGIFKNEHIMYTELLPKIVALQKEANVPESELLKYAKCHGSLAEEPNEVVILEDLKTLGFAMEDRFESLSDACVRSILKNFAVLHSLSFVIKEREPETYEYYKTNLFDMWSGMNEVSDMKMYFEQTIKDALEVMDKQEHIDAVKSKLLESMSVTENASALSKEEVNSKYSVIQQGDSWTNNILFKYPNENTVESIMIDYQLARNSSPASDLLYMIFNCTDHKSRNEHYYNWLDYYYTELNKSLSIYGLEAKDIYPRERLDVDLKRYGKLMLGISFMLSNILIRKPDDAAVMKDAMDNIKEMNEETMAEMTEAMKISKLDEESVARYKNKIVGLVESCLQFGLI